MRRIIVYIFVLLFTLACYSETIPEDAGERLFELGYTSEDISAAVSNFQRANGLGVTGIMDPATYNALMSPKALSEEAYLKAFLTETEVGRYYERGSTGNSVRRLQSQLDLLGYDVTVNGEFDNQTFYAVATFQALNSLEMHGKADNVTLTRLYSSKAIPCGDMGDVYRLSAGSSGAEVKELQNELTEAGYFAGNCTGIYGTATIQAVKAFQKINGIEENGEWNLYQQLLINYGKYKTKFETDEYKASLSLSAGLKHECVKELETDLKRLGYFTGMPDDVFDLDTYEAVRLLQEANGLITTGTADPETRRLAADENCVKFSDFNEAALTASINLGDEGYAVYLCASRLSELGFPINARAFYDEDLDAVISIFKLASGFIDVEGADSEVRQFMNSDAAPSYERAKMLSDNYLSQKQYTDSITAIVNAAEEAVGKPYDAGKSGPESFGTAGLINYCYSLAGIETRPTVSMQLESAMQHESFSQETGDVTEARQVFFKTEGIVYTGICVGSGMMVTAYPHEECVVQVSMETEFENYEFIGSVFWS